MEKIRVGLIGFGTVGSGLAQTLLSQRERLQQKVGLPIELSRVADINISELPAEFEDVALSSDAGDIFNDPEIDIVVELIGGVVFRPFHDPDEWDDVLDGSVRTCQALAAHGARRVAAVPQLVEQRLAFGHRQHLPLAFGGGPAAVVFLAVARWIARRWERTGGALT